MATSSQEKHNEKFNDKFASLINPIRDLAQNWNVDVASLLEDYISELELVKISFNDDPASEVMNFVEAALLIQNSACVYGKKVDYLFNLVMQLLDHLKCRSANPLLTKKRVVIRNTENVNFTEVEDIVEDKNLYLKESNNNDISAFTVARMPIEYLSIDKEEKSFPLYDSKDNLIGNRHDFRLNCWRSSYFKSMCEELNTVFNEKPINSAEIKQEPPDSHENGENQSAPGDWGLDDNSFHDDDSEEEPNIETNAEKENKQKSISTFAKLQDIKNYGLANSAEKALREWDPLYAHENIKQRLRPTRKNLAITLAKGKAMSAQAKKKAAKRNIATYLNDCSFSNSSKMPPKLSQMTEDAESLINIIQKEDKRRTEEKLGKNKDGSDKIGEDDNEGARNEPADGYENNLDEDSGVDHNDFDDVDNHEDEESRLNRSQFETTFDAFIAKETDKFLENVLDKQELSESEKIRKQWETYLLDKLQDEEKYVAFNVREYTAKVLNAFSPNNSKQTLPFSNVMEKATKLTKGEACRLFFASLQLANNYNVSIEQNSPEKPKTFDLTLLSRTQNFEAFDG